MLVLPCVPTNQKGFNKKQFVVRVNNFIFRTFTETEICLSFNLDIV